MHLRTGPTDHDLKLLTERDWIVLLEAADEPGGSSITLATVERLVSALAGLDPVSLHSPHRYAVQIRVSRVATPPEALTRAFGVWQEAVRRVGAPAWPLVRAEVMTPEELELEVDSCASQGVTTDVTPGDRRSHVPDPESEDLLYRALGDSLTELSAGGLL